MVPPSKLSSTRFFYIQEALAIGVLGAVAKTLWSSFPIVELYGFTGPIIAIAFGLKTWGHKDNGTATQPGECEEELGATDSKKLEGIITALLRSQPKWSDSKIATMVGANKEYVAKLRRRLSIPTSEEEKHV